MKTVVGKYISPTVERVDMNIEHCLASSVPDAGSEDYGEISNLGLGNDLFTF